VTEALSRIASEWFDVLMTDLHMPNPGDGFTVVSAMRHSQTGRTHAARQRLPRRAGRYAPSFSEWTKSSYNHLRSGGSPNLSNDRVLNRKTTKQLAKERVGVILWQWSTGIIEGWLAGCAGDAIHGQLYESHGEIDRGKGFPHN
jgi:hypothetical protein